MSAARVSGFLCKVEGEVTKPEVGSLMSSWKDNNWVTVEVGIASKTFARHVGFTREVRKFPDKIAIKKTPIEASDGIKFPK